MNKTIAGFEHVYIDKKSLKTLMLLHGTGGDEHDLVPIGEELDPAANILSPRGKVLESGMHRFFKRLAEGVFDREDLEIRSGELADFLHESSVLCGFPLNGVIAVGYSNGANIALYLIANNPEMLRSAILMRPHPAALPDKIADLHSVSVLILSGLTDSYTPPQNADKIGELLAEKGANIEVEKISAGHNLTEQDLVCAKNWLQS